MRLLPQSQHWSPATIAGGCCRLLAGGLAALVLFLIAGHGGLPPWQALTPHERMLLVALLGMTAGLLVMLRWLGIGGLITTVAAATFYVAQFHASGTWPRGGYLALFPTLGLLALLIAVWQRSDRRHSAPPASREAPSADGR